MSQAPKPKPPKRAGVPLLNLSDQAGQAAAAPPPNAPSQSQGLGAPSHSAPSLSTPRGLSPQMAALVSQFEQLADPAPSNLTPASAAPARQSAPWLSPSKTQMPTVASAPALVGSSRLSRPSSPRSNVEDASASQGDTSPRHQVPVPDSPRKSPPPAPASVLIQPASPGPTPIAPGEYAAFLRMAATPANTLLTSASSVTTATTTTTTSTSQTTTTTSTSSTVTSSLTSVSATAPTAALPRAEVGVEGGAVEVLKRRQKRAFRRSKSLERIAALEINLEKASLPKTVAELERQVGNVVRSETRDFTLIPSKEHSYALYRGRQDETWQVLKSVLAVKLRPLFTEALAMAQASPQWATLTQMLEPDQADDQSDAAREMLHTLAAQCFKVLLERLAGDGKCLLSSMLPPAMLHFLLEMDHQHEADWRPRSDRLLFFQLRFHRLKAVGARIRQLTTQDTLNEAERKSLATLREAQATMAQNWKACRDVLQGDRGCGQAHLLALARLTQMQLGAQELKSLGEQSHNFNAEFPRIRRQCLSSLLGPGCVGVLFKRHIDPSNRVQARFANALASLLKDHALVDRLLNCPDPERQRVREAARDDLPRLREEWEGIRSDLVLRSRTRALLEKSSSQKRGRKQFIESGPAPAPVPPPAPAPAQVTVPGTPRPARQDAPLEPPSLRLTRDNAKRRFAHITHFIEELHGLTAAMGAQVQTAMESVTQELSAWATREDLRLLTREAMLEKCLALLSQRLLGGEGVPGEPMGDLDVMFDLLNTLDEEKSTPANSHPGTRRSSKTLEEKDQ